MTDIIVPVLGESVTEATVGGWMVKAGDSVSKDDVLVELETDKVAVEVRADGLSGAPVTLRYPSVGATEQLLMAASLARLQ